LLVLQELRLGKHMRFPIFTVT